MSKTKSSDTSMGVYIGFVIIAFAVGYGVSFLVNSDLSSEHKEFYTETVYERIAWNKEIEGRVTNILCTRNARISTIDGVTIVFASPIPDPNYKPGDVSPYAYYTECVYTVEKEVQESLPPISDYERNSIFFSNVCFYTYTGEYRDGVPIIGPDNSSGCV